MNKLLDVFLQFERFFIISIGLIIILSGCQDKTMFNKENLLNYYNQPADSLKRKAVLFLLDNMSNHSSQVPFFQHFKNGERVVLEIDSIENDSILLDILNRRHLVPFYKIVLDDKILDNNILINNIDLAFQSWNKYIWADNIPEDIFFNYLLPYKIYGEKPEYWRSILQTQLMNDIELIDYFKDTTILLNEKSLLDQLYEDIVLRNVDKKIIYSPNPSTLTQFPALSELMLFKHSDCIGQSYMHVMVLRSIGIPATIDIVPLWGSKNSGHVTDVFWDSKLNKFRTVSGRELVSPNKFPPSKVFRYSYQKQNIWTDTIKPIIGLQPFLLGYLEHDNWLDVTHEHTLTYDIEYQIDEPSTSKFTYICVFNYGKWEPVFWGKLDEDKMAHFKNMSINILYRIAVPQENDFKIVSDIFSIDSLGNQVYYQANTLNKTTLRLQKVNEGSRSWLEKGKRYGLYFFNSSMEWELVEELPCLKDSILVFDNAPSNALYRILEHRGGGRLERSFTYQNNIQKFY